MAKKKKSSNQLEMQNAAKTLFANIHFMSPDDPIRTIVMTSSIPNEGKTTTSLYLAQAIASSGKSVVLVEADMRRRALAGLLRVHPKAGIYSVMVDAASLEQAVVETPTPNLYFLDVEPNIPNPADILASKRYAKLAKTLEDRFDYVVYDTPPVGTFIDAAILSTLADGVVLVVRPNYTKRVDVINSFEQLKKADANILGACANFCEGDGSEYYYAYYNREGSRVDAPLKEPEIKSPTPTVASSKAYRGKAARPQGTKTRPLGQTRR